MGTRLLTDQIGAFQHGVIFDNKYNREIIEIRYVELKVLQIPRIMQYDITKRDEARPESYRRVWIFVRS